MYYRTIKVKLSAVNWGIYLDFGVENNDKDSKFKVIDHLRISKYKNIFANDYTASWSKEVFMIKEVKNTVQCTYVISYFNVEEIVGKFYEKEVKRTNQTEFRPQNVLKKNCDKLYVKWIFYDDSCNIWSDQKHMVIQNELFSRSIYPYYKQNKRWIRFVYLWNKI